MADATCKRIDEMEATFRGSMRKVRAELGLTSFGVQTIDLPPDSTRHPWHDHAEDGQEERRRVVTDERLLPTGAIETLEMSAATLGADELHEVFVFEADRRLTVASDIRRLTVESLTGSRSRTCVPVASEPHVVVEALTAAPDALSRNLFPVASPGRPYRAALRLSVDDLSCDRSRLSTCRRRHPHPARPL